MTTNKQATITKDVAGKNIKIVREFEAPLEQVWQAWTEAELLDQWWAPKPWQAKTKTMNFAEGGTWLYCMVGPDGTQSWARADYKTIVPQKSFTAADTFCDENGIVNQDFPSMFWQVVFSGMGNRTKVEVEITFSREDEIEKILEMGFEAGFTAALGNLDELLEKQLQHG